MNPILTTHFIMTKTDFDLLTKIQKGVEQNLDSIEDLGIVSGIAGIMIFQFLYAKHIQSDEVYDKAKDMIGIGIEKINKGYNNPNYSNGLAGFCWGLQFLDENDLIEFDTSDFFSQIDPYLGEVLDLKITEKHYDFFQGVIGYGVYFLKRYKNTTDTDLKESYKIYLGRIVSYLNGTKIIEQNGVMWESFQPSTIEGAVNIDMGLAHGVPSIAYFMAMIFEVGLFSNELEPLINGAMTFMLSTKNKDKTLPSLFPIYIYDSVPKKEENSRLGWCYGDIGIGLSLLKIADVTSNFELKSEALEILKHTANRRGLHENYIVDAGLCHGAFGLAQIFGRLNDKFSLIEFIDAEAYWKSMGHNMAVYNDNGDVSFEIYKGERGWSKPISLLEGTSGIGLYLISSLTGFENTWDECLLIN